MRLTPSLADCIKFTSFGLCLNGSNPGAEPYVPDPGFNPVFMPPLPPPDNFAQDDIISNPTTLGAVVYSTDPAQPDDFALAPVGPTSMVYIVVLTVFEEDTTLGYTTVHGQYLDPAIGAAGLATQSISIHHHGEDGHFPEGAYSHGLARRPQHRLGVVVLILMAPLWYVQTHGTPLNWQRLHLLICTNDKHTPTLTVPMSP